MKLTKEEEHAREMAQFANSHYWKMIKEEIENMLEDDYTQLVVVEYEDFKRFQGKIQRAQQILDIVEAPVKEWQELNQEE